MAVGLAGIREGERVVDIGCGPGESVLLASRGAPGVRVIGTDPAWPCCLVTRMRTLSLGTRVRVHRCPAERLAVPDAWADLVVSINAFHHWADPQQGLREVRRILVPGGRVLLVDEDFPADHHHTRFHRETGHRAAIHAGSPEVRGWLASLGFSLLELKRVEDAEGTPHHVLRAVS